MMRVSKNMQQTEKPKMANILTIQWMLDNTISETLNQNPGGCVAGKRGIFLVGAHHSCYPKYCEDNLHS